MEEKKIVYTALQPTGKLTIGNYIGAVKNMLTMQDEFNCFYAIADLHSITVSIEPPKLRENTLEMFALLLACGVNPDSCALYVQSHVAEHSQLTWVLNCFTMMGEAQRMVQFKQKSKKNQKNVNVGLLDYPVLMAADILLYQADYVPIGVDQKQHLELCRVVAERFNGRFSPTFKIPEAIIPKHGAKIQSLTNPEAKMSKSDDDLNGSVYLLDDRDTIIRKFKKAVTDSGNEIKFVAGKKGISNLLTIHSAFSGKSIKELEKEFACASYADFKLAVGETVAEKLTKIQDNYKNIIADKANLARLMAAGAEKARFAARKTLRKVYKKTGFIEA